MGDKRKDGGPAGDMSMRDYFAAAAMPECLAMSTAESGAAARIAKAAYELADAMLEERDK